MVPQSMTQYPTSSRLKRVALVAAHFPPSNMASVHRARLWAQHLQEYGWQPVVVTTHWNYYEEMLDWELYDLVDPSLEVIRTKAFGVRPLKVIGDIGVRAFWWQYHALAELASSKAIDFIHVT